MNVASLELCKALNKLAEDWDNTFLMYIVYGEGETMLALNDLDRIDELLKGETPKMIKPAYDLGYLLRKLPAFIELHKVNAGHGAIKYHIRKMQLRYNKPFKWIVAETPEDCAVKLAVELFEQGILKKGAN